MNEFIKKPRLNSQKGVLLSGVNELLPSFILSHVILKKEVQNLLKNKPGVYALYNNEELYYIGLSKNLYKRLLKHTRDKHTGKWDEFKIFKVKNFKYIKDIETILLRVCNPPGNSISGLVPKEADINRYLLNIYKESIKADMVLHMRLQKRVSKKARKY